MKFIYFTFSMYKLIDLLWSLNKLLQILWHLVKEALRIKQNLNQNIIFNNDIVNNHYNKSNNISQTTKIEKHYNSLIDKRLPINDKYVKELKKKLFRIENVIEILKNKNKIHRLSENKLKEIKEEKNWPINNSLMLGLE